MAPGEPSVIEAGSDRASVRRAGRDARQGVVGAVRARAEESLIGHLKSLDSLSGARPGSVGVFVAHDGEPNLSPLIAWFWDRDVTVALPVLHDDPDDYTMRFVPWSPHDALERGRYGIPVPPEREAIEPATLLVSFTGFDRAGNRMGRGAGFFDRYLASSTATVIGVGFEAQRFASIPVEPHDQPLPIVVTDLGVRFIP